MMTNSYSGATAAPGQYRLFTLRNASGMTVTISERGAMLCSWRAPDRYGRMADVLQAEPEREDGQVARWQGTQAGSGVSLLLMGPGGNTHRQANYRLDDDGSLVIDHNAVATLATPFNVKSHPRFNLNGGNDGVDDHMLQIDADYYVEVDAGGAPIGVATVGGTPFDFRQPAAIGPRLRWPDTQIRQTGGFDHAYCVRSHVAGGQGALREVARVFDPGSGRRLQVHTTEAALQFRTGAGFCLESNARPDLMSVEWPQLILHPGQVYRQTTVYRLSLQG
jgi:aldose 1-epimerase